MLRLGVGVTRGRATVIKEAMKMLRCSGTIAAWKEQGDQGDQGRVTGIVSHTKALKGFSEMVLLPNQACLARNSWAPSSLVSSTPTKVFPWLPWLSPYRPLALWFPWPGIPVGFLSCHWAWPFFAPSPEKKVPRHSYPIRPCFSARFLKVTFSTRNFLKAGTTPAFSFFH